MSNDDSNHGDGEDEGTDVPERGRMELSRSPRYRSVRRFPSGPRARHLRLRRQLSIEQLIGQVIKLNKLTPAVVEHCIDVCWTEIVEERVAQRARPKALRDGVLAIGAQSSVWVHELQLKKSQILATINAWLHAQRGWLGADIALVDLRFGLDDRRQIADLEQLRRLRLRSMRRLPPPDREPPPVPDAVRASILSETSRIQDPALRAIIEDLRTTWGI